MGDSGSATAAPTKGWTCTDCGFVWEPTAILGQHYHISPQDQRVRCILKPYCRQRQLRRKLNLAGPGTDGRVLYGQIPTERLRHMADPRPPNWREINWRPIGTEMQRVEAYLLIHSVCFPVCMPYACKLNTTGDEVVYKRVNIRGTWITTLEAEPMTVGDIAAGLDMKHSNISRALKALIHRHLWKRDGEDHVIIFIAEPEPLTIEERRALVDEQKPEESRTPRGDLRELPAEFRFRAYAVMRQASDDRIKSDMRELLMAPVRRYNEEAAPHKDALRSIRTRRDQAVEEAIKACTILIPREVDLRAASTVGDGAEANGTAPAENRFSRGTESTVPANPGAGSVDISAEDRATLWSAGYGKGSYAKLPPPEERQAILTLIEAARPYIGRTPDANWISRITHSCREKHPDVTSAEIAQFIHQVGPQARKKDSPSGFLLSVVPTRMENREDLLSVRQQLTAAARPEVERPLCRECQGSGVVGIQFANLAELKAHPNPPFCTCHDGELVKWHYET
jgi:DNA-binding transcriptional ArsR family regulator